MATVNLGKIKLKWRGTWSSGGSYTADDVVEYTDGSVTSSYIAVAFSSNQAPSTGGTINSSYWNFAAKGQASSQTTTQGDIIVRGASADQRLAIGTAGQALKVNASANGLEYGEAGGMVKLASASLTGQSLSSIDLDYFSTTYKAYEFIFSQAYFSTNARFRCRLKRVDTDAHDTSNNYQWVSMHPYNQSSGTGSNTHGSWSNGEWELHGSNNVHQYWSCAGRITFYDPMSSTRKTQAEWKTVGEENDRGQANIHNGYGQFLHMEEIKGFRIFPTSGTISAINYTLFGIIS